MQNFQGFKKIKNKKLKKGGLSYEIIVLQLVYEFNSRIAKTVSLVKVADWMTAQEY